MRPRAFGWGWLSHWGFAGFDAFDCPGRLETLCPGPLSPGGDELLAREIVYRSRALITDCRVISSMCSLQISTP